MKMVTWVTCIYVEMKSQDCIRKKLTFFQSQDQVWFILFKFRKQKKNKRPFQIFLTGKLTLTVNCILQPQA